MAHILYVLTSSNIDRFSNLFHSQNQEKICNNKPKFTWLMSRHDWTVDTFDVSSESRRACRSCQAVLFKRCGRRTSYSARLYKCSRFMLLHTQILFVPSNKINVNSNKLVNNLHNIFYTNYTTKLRVAPVPLVVSNVSNQSSSSCRVCRAVLFGKLNKAKMHGFDTSNVSSRVVSRRVQWTLGYNIANDLTTPQLCRYTTL